MATCLRCNDGGFCDKKAPEGTGALSVVFNAQRTMDVLSIRTISGKRGEDYPVSEGKLSNFGGFE